jgi:D-amino peptidase
MKIYIFCDMEGISGITQRDHVMKNSVLYPLGCKLMEQDINACIEGCFQAGATGVIVRDGHSSGVNVNPFEIDPRAELVQGATPHCRFAGIDECDAVILLGYHAMAGTKDAVLEHTYSSGAIQNMWLNGKPAGEFAIDATIAAEHDVPTIMVSGDDKICAEARSFLPEIVTCQVKEATALYGARLLSPQKAHELITAKTIEAVKKINSIPKPDIPNPAKLKTELVERGALPSTCMEGVKHINGRTYEVTRATFESALLFI